MMDANALITRRAALHRGALLGLALVGVPMLGALDACVASREPRSIAYGRDECAFCRMVVSEPRYATALMTSKGRTLVFDSVECLASWCVANSRDAKRARSLRVSVSGKPDEMMPAEEAHFWRAERGSPMGKGLTALRTPAEARALGLPAGAELMRWPQVVALVEREGLQRGAGSGPARGA